VVERGGVGVVHVLVHAATLTQNLRDVIEGGIANDEFRRRACHMVSLAVW